MSHPKDQAATGERDPPFEPFLRNLAADQLRDGTGGKVGVGPMSFHRPATDVFKVSRQLRIRDRVLEMMVSLPSQRKKKKKVEVLKERTQCYERDGS